MDKELEKLERGTGTLQMVVMLEWGGGPSLPGREVIGIGGGLNLRSFIT